MIEETTPSEEQRFARELELGFQQAERDEWVDWDPEKIKTEGRAHVRN